MDNYLGRDSQADVEECEEGAIGKPGILMDNWQWKMDNYAGGIPKPACGFWTEAGIGKPGVLMDNW